jgi:hypothetical protein
MVSQLREVGAVIACVQPEGMLSLPEPGLQVADNDSGLSIQVRGFVGKSERYLNLYAGFAGNLDLYAGLTGNLPVPTGI